MNVNVKKWLVLLAALVLVFTLAACGSGSTGDTGGSDQTQGSTGGADTGGDDGNAGASSGGDDSGDTVRLVVGLWPGMGFEDLMHQYAEENNLELDIQLTEYSDHHTNLQTSLASGSGAPDIAGVEISYIERFKETPEHFHNLLDYGAGNVAGDYLDWKWEQAMNADQDAVLGLPTDIGPMAMIYRTDVFAEAGLPTDRNEVAQLLQTWEDFIEVGQQIKETTGAAMIDEGLTMFNLIVGQGEEKYFDRDNNHILDTNPQVQKAWDLTIRAIESGITGNLEDGSTEQVTAMNNGDYAVILAPAWEMTSIKNNAPDTAGLWDITQIPEGSGNWGGSFLTVPAQSDHPQEAYDLIEWVLAPEQQLELFTTLGNFPSTPSVYDSEALTSYVDDFFGGAPVGEIYSEAAQRVQPVWEGPYTHIAADALGDAVRRVERGQQDAQGSWDQAIADLERQLSRQ